MKGFRISHEKRRNAFYVISDPHRPYAHNPDGPSPCPTCRLPHTHKTYHILLNSEGGAVVSEGVYEGLRQAGAFAPNNLDRLEVGDTTANPPAVVMGTNNGRPAPVPARDQITIYHE